MQNPNVVVSSTYGPIIINVNDRFIGQWILSSGYWAEQDISAIAQLVNLRIERQGGQSVTFYDVGANIGTHSLALAKMFGARIKIRAFEAQRQIYYMLCGTVALNNLRNVHCHLNAVSDVAGETISFEAPSYEAANNFGGLELSAPMRSDNQDMVRAGEREEVGTVTIDSFGERVDFLKLDIEGMENLALRGAIATLRRDRPFLFVEIAKTDVGEVYRLLQAERYAMYAFGMDAIAVPSEMGLVLQGLNEFAPEGEPVTA